MTAHFSRDADSSPPVERVRRVLLVDDVLERCLAMRDVLETEGYDVVVLLDSADALDYVEERPPDIVVLNVDLREGSGMELCGELRMRDELRLTPIVLVSGANDAEENVVRGLLAGADDYIGRPDRVDEFRARIRVQLRNRRDRELLRWAELQRLRLKDAALCDALTGLPNRRAADRAIAKALGSGGPLMLMMVDIDHFKAINDKYGHAAGDEVLREVSKQLQRRARRDDIVARYGGEEFVILIHSVMPSLSESIAERYRAGLAEHRFPEDKGPAHVTISIGVAASDGSDPVPLTRERLLSVADQALYAAKGAGRNCIRISPTTSDSPDDSPPLASVPPKIEVA